MEEAKQETVWTDSYDPFATANVNQSVLNFLDKYNLGDMGKTRIRDGTVVLGKYELGKELSSGGYGSVYLCKNQPEKVIKVERVMRKPEQLFNEVQIQN